jgi:hypothetical protein
LIVTFGASAWPLFPIGLLCGAVAMMVFRSTSDPAALAASTSQIFARLLELRLFVDEPAIIWRAQAGLLRANADLLVLLIRPAVALSIFMVPLLAQLDAIYGRAPLTVGQFALVTAQIQTPIDAGTTVSLVGPRSIEDDRPAVRAVRNSQISWRIRPLQNVSGSLLLRVAGETVEKSVVAGNGPEYKSDQRTRNLMDYVLHPTERRLPEGPIGSIEIRYPNAEIRWFGLQFPWLVWFFLFSPIGGLAARRGGWIRRASNRR